MSTDFLPGNRLDLLETGSEYFPALLAAIEQASVEIRLESYIFENDITGHQIAGALTRAAQRGVAVHVMVDGFGARGFMQHLGGDLLAGGVEVLVYGPDVSPFTLRRHRLRRLHRKLAAIDARIAFIGGINIIDDMHTPGQIPPRQDYAVRIEGPLLAPIHASMRHLWQLVRWTSLPRRYKSAVWRRVITTPCGEAAAAFLVRDNLRHRRDIEEGYLEAIRAAHREILVANAYFLPGRRFRNALIDAARRGVKVTILLQGQVEYVLLHYATHALYGVLLSAGVHIHEYHKSFLHAKVAVIDGTWATVGSSNIDPFSLLLSREANLVVKNAAFAGKLLASMRRALEGGAREVRSEDWKKHSLPARIASWLAYTMVRLMVGLAGYAQKGDPRHRKAGDDATP
ncbi:MAG: cardiolipin synthase ClsB [Rhodocyclaceae bacterium]|nr:MAG: cardiolipin synthase ClsB [Rhodocyclaceae bacterium]